MRIAVLDLGTNTFNLLIVDMKTNGEYEKVFNEKLAPKIGLGGINDCVLSAEGFERGLVCLETQSRILQQYKPDKTYVFGTSALRNASNGREFTAKAKERTGLEIHVIDGNKEAELIYHGNRAAVDFGEEDVLILDIGGGSNEFIIASKHGMKWKQSFEIGVSRLLQLLVPHDPLTVDDIRTIELFVDSKLSPLYEAVRRNPVRMLVGSSGAFDTFRSMIVAMKGEGASSAPSYELDIRDFRWVHNMLISLPQSELVNVKGMDPHRVDMLGIASVLVDFVLRKLEIRRVVQSSFSLKEGVLFSLIHT